MYRPEVSLDLMSERQATGILQKINGRFVRIANM